MPRDQPDLRGIEAAVWCGTARRGDEAVDIVFHNCGWIKATRR